MKGDNMSGFVDKSMQLLNNPDTMPRKAKPNTPRELMLLAIEIMKQSVAETRSDGKIPPKVGAVIVKADGSIETACRGELRQGDHAEFTLIERKNRDAKLDGAILYTTLEPCAPGARDQPKRSCAERIADARIKEVWIGIEDRDPKVDGKGIAYLQERQIAVQMFDRDLQVEIRKENALFLDQAIERAAGEPAAPRQLSPLEGPVRGARYQDLSREAIEKYCVTAGIDASAPAEWLRAAGLTLSINGEEVPTGFGLILFGDSPRTCLQQAGLLATIRYPDGTVEIKDFDGPAVLIPEAVEAWLKDKLPSVVDRSSMKRKRIHTLPFDLVREGVVNALVHRDYSIEGAKIQLVVTPDSISIDSPGVPPPPITIEKLQSFSAPMLSRNPILHHVFARLDLAEERGLGLDSLRSRSIESGLPLPTFGFDDPYLRLVLYRNSDSALKALPSGILDRMTEDQKEAWVFASARGTFKSKDLEARLEVDERKAQRLIRALLDLGLVRREGKGPSTTYESVGASRSRDERCGPTRPGRI